MIDNTMREMFRTNFDATFLIDLTYQIVTMDHDPRNHIGKRFGFDMPRALEISDDNMLSDLSLDTIASVLKQDGCGLCGDPDQWLQKWRCFCPRCGRHLFKPYTLGDFNA